MKEKIDGAECLMGCNLRDLIWRGQPLDIVQGARPSKGSVWSSESWQHPGGPPGQWGRVWLCCGSAGAGTNGPRGLTWGPGPGQGRGRPGRDNKAPLVPSDFQMIYPASLHLPEKPWCRNLNDNDNMQRKLLYPQGMACPGGTSAVAIPTHFIT